MVSAPSLFRFDMSSFMKKENGCMTYYPAFAVHSPAEQSLTTLIVFESILKPLAKTSVGVITTWVSMPILIVAALVLVEIIHFLFVR